MSQMTQFNHSLTSTMDQTLPSKEALAQFVIWATKQITTLHFGMNPQDPSQEKWEINWMAFLYHSKLNHSDATNIYQRLNTISPLLPLFQIASYYNADSNPMVTNFVSILILIRESIPQSVLTGIDHRRISTLTPSPYNHQNENHEIHPDHGMHQNGDEVMDQMMDHRYQCLDFEQLFGENVAHFLWLDLCKYIVSFLDIPNLLKLSAINHCWLHLIFRNDTFCTIFNDIIGDDRILKCTMTDHSMCSQAQVATAPLAVGYTLNLHQSRYLDFITLKTHWFQKDVDLLTVTLQQKHENDQNDKWQDVQQRDKISSNEIGFDSVFLLHFEIPREDALFRMKVEILKPFPSTPIYSEEYKLNPLRWIHQYNESKARDEDAEKYDNDGDEALIARKLFHIHKVWWYHVGGTLPLSPLSMNNIHGVDYPLNGTLCI